MLTQYLHVDNGEKTTFKLYSDISVSKYQMKLVFCILHAPCSPMVYRGYSIVERGDNS